MPSKVVVDLGRACDAVVQAGRTHKAAIREAVAAKFAAEGRPAPDTDALVDGAVDYLQGKRVAMEAADLAHDEELLDDEDPRKRRNDATSTCREALLEIREGVEYVYGAETVAAVGFSGPTPEDPRFIAAVGALVVSQFAGAIEKATARPRRSFDSADALARLRAGLADLTPALKDVAREQKEADATLVAKHAAIAAFEQAYSEVAGLLSALLIIAGEHELAARVKPPQRTATRVAEPVVVATA